MQIALTFVLSCVLVLQAACFAADAGTEPFPGKKTDWNGYAKYDFAIEGNTYLVVVPKEAAPGKPWIWRAEFFGHEPQGDIALLGKGWHVVHNANAAGQYGGPKGVAVWDAAYAYLTKNGLSAKPVLEGFSRGGLLCYNWAVKNPDKVAGIYGDAPVCDFKSWPGGKGKGPGSKGDWQNCLKCYGLTEEQAMAYKQNPVDMLEVLAKAKVPLFHIAGDADKVVPIEENTNIIAERYKKLGGDIQLIIKPGVDHHPHSVKDPAPIVEFCLKCLK
ncbi:MAG TPA: alpha/beta hydrolase [Planctomycetota bacterium]|jgi:hypothetical protein